VGHHRPDGTSATGAPLTGHIGVVAMAFAPDGRTLATVGHDDDTIVLRDLSGLQRLRAHLMERACAITGGGLSRSEWARTSVSRSSSDGRWVTC
jgi:hypothetical protein